MNDTIEIGNPPISVALRRNVRAKRLILRVARAGRGPVLTLPPGACSKMAEDFLRKNEHWLRGRISSEPVQISVTEGVRLPFRDADISVARTSGRRTEIRDGILFVPGASDMVGARVAAFLKESARSEFDRRSRHYANKLGRNFGRMTLRDTRSRWGSCSSDGNLMYSWRLIMAPTNVLDYVVAHEVAHLVEMNHSARFWSLVRELRPDYDDARLWLRNHGAGLHAFEFLTPGQCR